MNINLEIKLAKGKVDEGYDYTEIVNYLADKKIYHTIAVLVFKEAFKVDLDFAKEYIYANKYYLDFKNEHNSFNDDFVKEI